MNIIAKRLIRKLTADNKPNWYELFSDVCDEYMQTFDETFWKKVQDIAEKDHNDPIAPLATEKDYQLIKNTSLKQLKDSIKKQYLKRCLNFIYESEKIYNEKGVITHDEKENLLGKYNIYYNWLDYLDIPVLYVDLPADNNLNYRDTLGEFFLPDVLYNIDMGHGDSWDKFNDTYDEYFNVSGDIEDKHNDTYNNI